MSAADFDESVYLQVILYLKSQGKRFFSEDNRLAASSRMGMFGNNQTAGKEEMI